ncbi:MAG: hypothetical protein HY892_18925 [Deltaproteobacteria bacterium]|nr:hypothetical protein [Deltaproteobacteria bacterium]
MIAVMFLLLGKRIGGIFNVSGDETMTFPEMVKMMGNPWITSNEKLKRETGYQFRYDTRQAFKDFARS